MTELSKEQEALKSSIAKSALIWGTILGIIAAAITFWLTGDMSSGERAQTTGFIGGGVGFVVFLLISWSKSKSAKCTNCKATFSISRTNRSETLVSSEEKSEHEKLEGGGSKLTEWVEEKLDVMETYGCSSCNDITIKEFQITRKKDEIVREKGARKSGGDDVVSAKGGESIKSKGKKSSKQAK